MKDLGQILMIALTAWIVFAFVGAYISQAKGRPAFEGVVFGFMLGPFGLLVAALMPAVKPSAQPAAGADAAVQGRPRPEQDDRPRSMRRIGGAGDDRAMDFVMDMIRESERAEPGRGVPRIVKPNGRHS